MADSLVFSRRGFQVLIVQENVVDRHIGSPRVTEYGFYSFSVQGFDYCLRAGHFFQIFIILSLEASARFRRFESGLLKNNDERDEYSRLQGCGSLKFRHRSVDLEIHHERPSA